MIAHPRDQMLAMIDFRGAVVIAEYLASIAEHEQVVQMGVRRVLRFGLAQDARLGVATAFRPAVTVAHCVVWWKGKRSVETANV